MTKLAIVGSRKFTDNDKFTRIIEEHIRDYGVVTCVVSGGAVGVDTLAYQWAIKNNIPFDIYCPNYHAYGARAPLKRNHLIVAAADAVLALPAADSRGTNHTIYLAGKVGKPVYIVRV